MNAKIAYLYGKTKSSLKDYSIDVFKSSDLNIQTKSGKTLELPDTLLYLLNFGSDSGFAVLSASRKLSEDTFCITEKGSISNDDLKDAIENMTNKIEYDSTRIIPVGEKFLPSLLISSVILDASDVVTYDKDDIETYSDETYGPFIKTKWGQTTIGGIRVFNRYTPNHSACGCVVTAVAQIMEYNKYPEYTAIDFDGEMCYWNEMEKICHFSTMGEAPFYSIDTSAFNQVAHFVRELGKHDNVKVRYGDSEEDESGAYAEGAQRTFQHYGYQDVDKHLGFGKKKRKIADKCLRGGRPVYLDGLDNGEGHAWVLDGLRGDYYHINWGWYGKSDGYYSKGVFRTSQRNDIASIDKQEEAEYSHFYKNFRMVTYGSIKHSTPIE